MTIAEIQRYIDSRISQSKKPNENAEDVLENCLINVRNVLDELKENNK